MIVFCEDCLFLMLNMKLLKPSSRVAFYPKLKIFKQFKRKTATRVGLNLNFEFESAHEL